MSDFKKQAEDLLYKTDKEIEQQDNLMTELMNKYSEDSDGDDGQFHFTKLFKEEFGIRTQHGDFPYSSESPVLNCVFAYHVDTNKYILIINKFVENDYNLVGSALGSYFNYRPLLDKKIISKLAVLSNGQIMICDHEGIVHEGKKLDME